MLLAIDVGNTDTKLGYFVRAADGRTHIARTWRIATARRRTSDEYGILFRTLFDEASITTRDVDGIVVSSVVPQIDRVLSQGCADYLERKPLFFTAATQRLIEVQTDRPSDVGADLVAAAVGVVSRYGSPAIVVGFGTATTFGAVSPEGAYLGVAIAPGIQISIDALATRTAKLPQIALEAPQRAIGRDTVSSLQSGIVYGFVGQVEGMVARIRAELGERARVVATGGLADVIAKHTTAIDAVDPHLTFEGLRLYYEAVR